jgi:competence protein ComEA
MKATWCALLVAAQLWGQAAPGAAQAESCPPCEAATERAQATVLVNLNTATEEELCSLPGIGPARARAIIEFREAHGGFRSISQLMRIKGIGRSMFRRLRPLVTVEAPGQVVAPSS